MAVDNSKSSGKNAVQTTGHAWDGDIQEFNNPIPNWWLWSFYATVVFAIVYWIFFPAWPIGDSYTKGVMNDITYVNKDGKEVTSHWTTRALYMKEMQKGRELQAKHLTALKETSYEDILADTEKTAFSYSMAKVLFADNCAACHQAGGAGVIGAYPNLADDSWLWGGTFVQIEKTISDGHNGFMPGFGSSLSEKQLEDVASYVLSLSSKGIDKNRVQRGKTIFNGQAGGCYYCHTKQATGMTSMGSANLTDAIWTIADVNEQDDVAEKVAVIKDVIRNGISRQMPAWSERLSPEQIKILTLYVHELGGGK